MTRRAAVLLAIVALGVGFALGALSEANWYREWED